MENKTDQLRLKELFQMLLELAVGNFDYRIIIPTVADELDELGSLLNEFAERMTGMIETINGTALKEVTSQINYKSIETDVKLIQNVLDFIHQNLIEPLPTTHELAKMFGTNEFTLKDNFRKIIKTSIYQYYTDLRLKKACSLILSSSVTLKEVAFLSGFNDYVNFSKAFKKKYGIPPSQFGKSIT